MDKWGANEPVGFPNTAYYLPVIYAILGMKVEKLGDMEPVLKRCRRILPPPVKENHPLPYLGPALDAGMATFFAEEMIEAIRYLTDPNFYTKTGGPHGRQYLARGGRRRHPEETRRRVRRRHGPRICRHPGRGADQGDRRPDRHRTAAEKPLRLHERRK